MSELDTLRAFVEDIRGELRMGYGEGHGPNEMLRIIKARNRVYLKLTTSEEQQLMGRPEAEYSSPHSEGYVAAIETLKPGQWLEMMTPHIQRFEVAAKFDGEAVFNSVGAAAMAKIIKKMATLIDEEVHDREAKQMGVGE